MATPDPAPRTDVTASNDGSGDPLTRQYLAAMSLLGIQGTDRSMVLDAYQGFCDGCQHDHQPVSWDGSKRDPGVGYMRERLRPQGFVPVNAAVIPSKRRKPDAAVPLARQVVSRFTEMLCGQGRVPQLVVPSDKDTQEYLEALFSSAHMWDTITQARDVAGACGAAVIACGLVYGTPSAEVLHPRDCWVAEWDETVSHWRPKVLVEQTLVEREVQDEDSGVLTEKRMWRTRAWTPEAIVYWPEVAEEDVNAEGFEWPAPEVKPHELGMCPVVWYQNTRDTKRPEGNPDCEGAWELLDAVDRVQSQQVKATMANVDPTLVIKEEERFRRQSMVVRKGAAIRTSPQGDARYLEMQGTSIQVAMDTVQALTDQVLQTVECVIIRPEHAKAYQSGEALQILWRSMESKANRLRSTLEVAVKDLARIWLAWGRKVGVSDVEVGGGGIHLPPREVVVDLYQDEETGELVERPDDEGEVEAAPPANRRVEWRVHSPGHGVYVHCQWPAYWQPTAAQIQSIITALMAGTGGKQVVSSETAVRFAAQYLGADPEIEARELEREKQRSKAEMAATFESGLGDLDDDDDDADDGDDGEDEPPSEEQPRGDEG